MCFLTRLFQSIREAFRPIPGEPDWATLNRHWPTVTTRSRWVAGP
jgi:hypothetical protein